MEHWVSVLLHGHFGMDEAGDLRKTLSALISSNGIVRVDLRVATRLSSFAVLALVGAGREARRIDCEFTVIAPPSMNQQLRLGLDDHDRALIGLHAADGA